MTSRQHQDWINHGWPDSGLAKPLAQFRDYLRARGFTVYDFPNDEHLDDQPPQDHTFYSETGWPSASPKWWRHAIDIMPKSEDAAGARELQALGAQIVADRNAGRITWLKYINWPASGSLSSAVQDRWEPSHERRSSSDTGHIHLSSITGVETLDAPYNPLGGSNMSALFDDNLARELSALFNAKGTVQLDVGGGTMKSFPVPLMGVIAGLQSQAASNGSGLTQLMTAVGQLAETLKGVVERLDAIQAGASVDVPITITGTGTAHIGGPAA